MSESDDPRHVPCRPTAAGPPGCAPGSGPRVKHATGRATPSWIVSHELPLQRAPEAYQHFDARGGG